MKTILVIHGPNLNLLGQREPHIYGKTTLKSINNSLEKVANKAKVNINLFHSNHEGEIVEAIHKALKKVDLIIINPAGLTHSSVSIRDAIQATEIPTIEVHISNVYKREEFRRKSLISGVALGTITGFGSKSYLYALMAAIDYLKSSSKG